MKRTVAKTTDRVDKTAAVQEGIKCLLRNSILDLYYECQEKGFANLADRENFESMYMAYKRLNGNGVIEEVKKGFENLPGRPNHPQRRKSDKEVWYESSDDKH